MSEPFVIVSPKHTIVAHRYVTFWRPDRKGYCWPLSWAGYYGEADARDIDDTPQGDDEFAVPLSVALSLSERPRKGDIDGDAGPVVRRTRANMDALRAARLARTAA